MGFVERIIERLREGAGFSRNRHFGALSSPEGRRALRAHRHLRSLERALGEGIPVEVKREGDRVRIVLTGARVRRVAFLNAEEYRMLREGRALPDPE